jgi:hypothetical protein
MAILANGIYLGARMKSWTTAAAGSAEISTGIIEAVDRLKKFKT